jgi:segregation and condensation protein A
MVMAENSENALKADTARTEYEAETAFRHRDSYQFKLKDFEGPLDLLLFLIRKNEVSLYDIPIAEITEQYLGYLQFAEGLDLDQLSDFYLMASTLLLIKSQMLLPVELSEEDDWEDPRGELVEQLIEYQKYRRLSSLMEESAREAEWLVERKDMQRNLPFSDEPVLQKADVWDLLKVFSRLMKNMSAERIVDMYEEVSINEKVALIDELLDKKQEFNFTELIVRQGSILDIVCAFLAVLETTKDKLISIYQDVIFSDIIIKRNSNYNGTRDGGGDAGNAGGDSADGSA